MGPGLLDERARVVEQFRLEYARRRVATEFAAGRLTDAQRQTQEQILQQRVQTLPQVTLDRLVDARVQAALATQEGVSVDEAAIDARLVEEATTPELRRTWVIEVRPARDEGATDPSAAQKAAAALPIGSTVPYLPPNCTSTVISNTNYFNCNGVFYKPGFQGNQVVYIVSQP